MRDPKHMARDGLTDSDRLVLALEEIDRLKARGPDNMREVQVWSYDWDLYYHENDEVVTLSTNTRIWVEEPTNDS